jgi:Ni/Fe-hydrogenase subunit HybB-like protein
MCVMLYSTVLVLELLPVVIESSTRLSRNRLLVDIVHALHRIMPVVALTGMGLSLLHQSSLGATYGILTARPVWYSPSAPVLFILSAIAGGISMTLLVTILSGKIMRREMVPQDILEGVARFAGFACLAYLYLKLWSWAATNYYSNVPEQRSGMEILAQYTPYNYTFWFGEVLFGALIPAVILLRQRLRSNPYAVMLAALMVIAGLVINRWNVTLSGFVIPLDWAPGVRDIFPVNVYQPAPVEWGVAIGIVGYGWAFFTLAVRFLKALYPESRPTDAPELPASAVSAVPAITLAAPVVEAQTASGD